MKAGRTIQEMCLEIQRQSEAKADYLINTASLRMEPWGNTPMLHVLDESGADQVEPLEILDNAHQQIGAYLNIPRKYYERMQNEDPDLLAYNVNRWFEKEPEQRMVRTIDGRARAFLSNRYRRLDNLDIAKVTLPIIAEMPEARYESCQLTDNYMYIKVVNPRLTAEVVPGDVVQAGIVISNSETGRGAVYVRPMIFRLVCRNGMTVSEIGTRRNHIGRISETDENFLLYSKETLKADDEAFVRKIQDSVRAAVQEAKFAAVVEKLKQCKEIKLDTGNIQNIVKMTGSALGYTDPEGEGIFQRLIEEADYTLYGLANAVTRYSQDVEDYDRASKLEEIGYTVLTMSPEFFRAVNSVQRIQAAA